MEQFDFHGIELMWLPSGPVVCGRCGDAAFGVGDVFTELHCASVDRQGTAPGAGHVELTLEAEVRFRVVEMSAYGGSIQRLYPGGTAGVRLDGDGLEWLTGADFAADTRIGRYWSLWGQRAGAGVPNCGTFAYPQPGAIGPECLTPTVVALAQAIYAGYAFDLMPILADALQDTGCCDADILNHCRGPGPHSRLCHVLNRILGHS